MLKILKRANVLFEDGLSLNEVVEIERIYDISFPKSLKNLLMTVLPVSTGFYNWRNTEISNIDFIKSVIYQPVKYIDEMPHEIYWCEQWGEEPKDEDTFNNEVRKRLKQAPKLIPIFLHRYMPILEEADPPVLSIHGSDIIFMGKNLKDYMNVEFGYKKQNEIQFSNIKPIRFWTDLM